MNSNQIERALCDDPGTRPSPEFASRVMGAVRRQAVEREALRFPWPRLLAGLAATVAVTTATLLFAPAPEFSESTRRVLGDPRLIQAATWVPTTLLGTWMLVRGSLRLAGYRG